VILYLNNHSLWNVIGLSAPEGEILSSWDLKKQQVKRRTKDEIFTPIQKAERRKGLKIGIYGKEKCGKTRFLYTCPEPVYIIGTEFGTIQLAHEFPNKEVYLTEVMEIDIEKDEPLPIESLDALEEAVFSLKDVTRGTICIDSGSDFWSWVSSWNYKENEMKLKKGKFMQFDWEGANERYLKNMMVLVARPTHFVITGQAQGIWVGGQQQAGYDGRWQRTTVNKVDIIMDVSKNTDKEGITTWEANIESCRFAGVKPFVLKNDEIDFQHLVSTLHQKFKVPLRIMGVTEEDGVYK